MHDIDDYQTAKWILSSKDDFGAPSMLRYLTLLEAEANTDLATLKQFTETFLPFMHGQEHKSIRKVINELFTKDMVKQWLPVIDGVTVQRINQLSGNTKLDLIADIMDPLYMDMVENLFGVALPDRGQFIKQIDIATNAVERMASLSQLKRLQITLAQLDQLLSDQFGNFAERTLFFQIIRHTESTLPHQTIKALLAVLLIAPRATTETLAHIISAYSGLASDQRQKLQSTGWVENHVDDLIRLYASTNILSKEAKKDMLVKGCPVSFGTQLMINIPRVNRDPEKYGDRVTLAKINDEARSCQHLTFGAGPHICLGMELAKAIIRSFIPRFFSTYPQVSCANDEATFSDAQIAVRIKSLPVYLVMQRAANE